MEKNNYTKEERNSILFHRVVLFIVAYLTFSLSAMTDLITLYPIVGHLVCVMLSGMIAYFMSFTLHEYVKTKGTWVYGIVIAVVLFMLMRYSG